MNVPAPYAYVRHGRSWATLIAVLGVWIACLVALLVFDAAGWIIALILLFTLPALWDLWSGTNAGASLDTRALHWHSGARTAEIPLQEIDHIRLVTRFDFSVRAAVVLTSGRKIRLPAEATPPHRAFETALQAHGITTQRHHFGFL